METLNRKLLSDNNYSGFIDEFCHDPAEIEELGKPGKRLQKLFEWKWRPGFYSQGNMVSDVAKRHSYRDILIKITADNGQTEIVDACLLADLEALRTGTDGGIVGFKPPSRGGTLGTEFAVSTALEVARLINDPEGRVKKKLDEIPLATLSQYFRRHIAAGTKPDMRLRTYQNLAILAIERAGKEPPEEIEGAKNQFVLSLEGADEAAFMQIPDSVVEILVPNFQRYANRLERFFTGIANSPKLTNCPNFRAMLAEKRTEFAARDLAQAEEDRSRIAAYRAREDLEAARAMTEFEKEIDGYEASEEIFALDLIYLLETGREIKSAENPEKYGCLKIAERRERRCIADFDHKLKDFKAKCHSPETIAKHTALSTKLADKKALWLAAIDDFTKRPNRKVYEDIVINRFKENDEQTLENIDKTLRFLSENNLTHRHPMIVEILSERKRQIQTSIKENDINQIKEEHSQALAKYKRVLSSIAKKKAKLIRKHGCYHEDRERKHIESLIAAKSDYLRELFRIYAFPEIGALSDTETEDDEVIAYVTLAKIVQNQRNELRLAQLLLSDDVIMTEAGSEIEMTRLRLQMIDCTTPHEVGHIIDRDAGWISAQAIKDHLDELTEIFQIRPNRSDSFRSEVVRLMEECMMDGIGLGLTQRYGTSKPEHDTPENRMKDYADAFVAVSTIVRANIIYGLKRDDENELIKKALLLLRFHAAAEIYAERTDAVNLTQEIANLEKLYLLIQIPDPGDSRSELLIDSEVEEKTKALFKAMFQEGFNVIRGQRLARRCVLLYNMFTLTSKQKCQIHLKTRPKKQ